MKFTEVLETLQEGETEAMLDLHLETILLKLRTTGKGGSVTLSLDVKPNGDGKVILTGRVTSKLPAPEATPTNFYLTEEGVLTRKHPRQREMDFNERKN